MTSDRAAPDDGGADELVEVIVESGPTGLPPTLRVPRADVADGHLTVAGAGGHDHLELVGVPAGRTGRPVFRWTMRTAAGERPVPPAGAAG